MKWLLLSFSWRQLWKACWHEAPSCRPPSWQPTPRTLKWANWPCLCPAGCLLSSASSWQGKKEHPETFWWASITLAMHSSKHIFSEHSTAMWDLIFNTVLTYTLRLFVCNFNNDMRIASIQCRLIIPDMASTLYCILTIAARGHVGKFDLVEGMTIKDTALQE